MNRHRFGFDPMVRIVAVTGGPCAGKTTFLAKVRQWLENSGCMVVILGEAATELIMAGFSPIPSNWKFSLSFQKFLLSYILEREELYCKMLKSLDTKKPLVILCDRGALDAIAYIGREAFIDVAESLSLEVHKLRESYSAVIHLVTAADGALEFYTLENNTARTETPDQAVELDKMTIKAWQGHQHHIIIDNRGDFANKMSRALQSLARVLHMPAPIEIERKYRLYDFKTDVLPASIPKIEIVQHYLVDEGEAERRVRARTLDGSTSYYYTEKRSTDNPMKRVEVERQVTRGEYERLLREADSERYPIVKTRYPFQYFGKILEIDVYGGNLTGLVIVEVELQDEAETVVLPEHWRVVEVTEDRQYKNASLAKLDSSLGTTLVATTPQI